MDSNFQWQKHQADERRQNRLREAETHRMLKEASQQREFFLRRGLKWLFRGIASSGQSRRRSTKEEKREHKPRLAK